MEKNSSSIGRSGFEGSSASGGKPLESLRGLLSLEPDEPIIPKMKFIDPDPDGVLMSFLNDDTLSEDERPYEDTSSTSNDGDGTVELSEAEGAGEGDKANDSTETDETDEAVNVARTNVHLTVEDRKTEAPSATTNPAPRLVPGAQYPLTHGLLRPLRFNGTQPAPPFNPQIINNIPGMRMKGFRPEIPRGFPIYGRGRPNFPIGRGINVVRDATREWPDPFEQAMNMHRLPLAGPNMGGGYGVYCSERFPFAFGLPRSFTPVTSIFHLFYPGETGTVEVGPEVVDGRAPCSVMLQGQSSVYEQLNILSKLPDQRIGAKTGEDVLVEDEKKGFLRGVILGFDNGFYLVGLVDYGKVVKARRVHAITDELKSVLACGGTILFSGNEFSRSKLIKFRVKERRLFGVWVCDVIESDAKDISEIILEEWVPPLQQGAIPLQDGCRVAITQTLDGKSFYVRRVDNPYNDKYLRFNNDIATHCIKAKSYKTIPSRGEICCARYEKDGCYYRANVRWAEEHVAVIKFMDFGTEQLCEISDLRYLPSLPKKVPRFCQIITLENVSPEPTLGGICYLKMLTAYKCELILSCHENSMSEVVLTDRFSGEVVNDVLRSFEISEWGRVPRAPLKTWEIYTMKSIKEVSFKCGRAEDIYLLHFDVPYFKRYGIFFGTINNKRYLDCVNTLWKAKMSAYCSRQTPEPYVPKKGELCIVFYEAQWHRAVCLDERDGVYKVTLIDLGVTTWNQPTGIRKILKDFLDMPALALKCAISGIHKMNDAEKNEHIAFLNNMRRQIIPGVKINERSQGVYYITLDLASRNQ